MSELSTQSLVRALALKLGGVFPCVPVYANPNQQGTKLPAFFITFMPSEIRSQVDNRFLRTLKVDLIYLERHNLPDLYDRYLMAAERLDLALETFPLGETVLRTLERKWFVELDALHYQFTVKGRVAQPNNETQMEVMERLTEEVKYE